MQPAGTDVFDTVVDVGGEVGQGVHRVLAECQRHRFRPQQRRVLLQQRVLGFRQNPAQIVARQRRQFDADRQAPLQFRQQVGRLGQMKRAGGDEQHVVGLHQAVLGVHRGALDQRQQIALHALTGHVPAAHAAVAGAADFVDLVDEDDAVVLRVHHRVLGQAVVVEEVVGFLLLQQTAGGFDGHAALLALAAPPHHALHHFGKIDHLSRRHAGQVDLPDRVAAGFLHGDVDFLLLELARTQHAAEFGARVGRRVLAHQGGDQALFRVVLRLRLHLLAGGFAQHVQAGVHQIADDAFHVAADITDLGEFGRLDLQERRLREARQSAGDLGFAATGRADHQDILRHDLFAHGLR